MLNKIIFCLINKHECVNNTHYLFLVRIDEYINTNTSNCEVRYYNETDNLLIIMK